MPLTHTREFRVRHYECDAYGHLNNVAYVRFMQEAAFDASAAAGYDLARYRDLGRHWLVRETAIEYLRPARYGDTVAVQTWIVDFRAVRSRRAYALTNAATGEAVARAHTDWVFVDTATGRPAPIPAELVAAFFPEGAPPPAPRREVFPDAPPPPDGVFVLTRRVLWQDVDPVGHVNNAVYLAYVEDCGLQLSAAFGWPLARLESEGVAIVPRRHHVEYRQPALFGDDLEVATWFSEVGRASALRHYAIRRPRDGELLARVNTHYVWVDRAGGRPHRIPQRLLEDFAHNRSAPAPGT